MPIFMYSKEARSSRLRSTSNSKVSLRRSKTSARCLSRSSTTSKSKPSRKISRRNSRLIFPPSRHSAISSPREKSSFPRGSRLLSLPTIEVQKRGKEEVPGEEGAAPATEGGATPKAAPKEEKKETKK